MSNFINDIIKNANDQIKYKETVVTGEVTADNGDGTYNVKIANSPTAYPNVETATYGDTFSVGEIAIITFEYGNKEMPRLWGHAKKIKQDPVEVEVDYSSGEGGGLQEETVGAPSGFFFAYNFASYGYAEIHDAVDENDLTSSPFATPFAYKSDYIDIGQGNNFSGPYVDGCRITYEIDRGLLFFDTSSIPAGATITSAKISLYYLQKWIKGTDHHNSSPYWTYTTGTDFDVVIQDGQPNYPRNPVVNSDYYYANYKNNGGQINTADITDVGYYDITLNSNGLAWINKGGITKLSLRSSRDIANIAPSYTLVPEEKEGNHTESESIEFDLEENAAKITITYTI